MSDRAVIIASFITLTVEHALRTEPDFPPLLSQRDYGTFATKQQSKSLKPFSNQLLQEKFREKNLYVWNSLLFVFRACCMCKGLLLLNPLIFIAHDMKHLRLKACFWVPGTIWHESIFWAATGNKRGGRLEIRKSLTQPTLHSETVLHSNNCAQLCNYLVPRSSPTVNRNNLIKTNQYM